MLKTRWKIAWIIGRGILKTFAHFEVEGLDRLKGLTGPVIIVANHVSYLDPPILGIAIPLESDLVPVRFLARKEIYMPLVSRLISLLGAIQLDTENPLKAIKQTLRLLKQGETIAIFPEGTRSLDGRLTKFMDGAEFLVSKTGVPVLPAVIIGTFKPGEGFLSGVKKTLLFLIGSYKIKVVFGPLLSGNIKESYAEFYGKVMG